MIFRESSDTIASKIKWKDTVLLLLKTPSLTPNVNLHQTQVDEPLIVPANTFTSSYSAKEDRIRLAVNYNDYSQRVDFWITRSFLLKLLPSWEEFFYKHSDIIPATSTPSFQTSKNATPSKPSDIPNSSKTDSSTLQLMEKEGLLLESVDMQFDRAKNRFKITLKGPKTEAFAYLTPQMMIGVLRSIFQAAPHMQWGISPALLG